jgi:hypothetical protein
MPQRSIFMRKLIDLPTHAPWCSLETGAGACDCVGHAPRRAGVYLLYGESGLAYVGQTSHFRSRVQSHSYARRFQIGKIAFRPIENDSERLAIG